MKSMVKNEIVLHDPYSDALCSVHWLPHISVIILGQDKYTLVFGKTIVTFCAYHIIASSGYILWEADLVPPAQS